MIVIEFIVTLITIYASAGVGIIVFAGVGIGGLFLIDELESVK